MDTPQPTADRRRWALALILTLAYTLSYVDRQVLSLLVEPIRASLHLSDTQFGLVQGISFSLCFVLASLPLARLADRGNRPRIMAACAATWSVATMACGLVGNFWQLLAGRTGVAMAEAGLPPSALTLMADRLDRRMLARATSIFMLGPFIGGGIALAGGGALYAMTAHWTMPVLPLIGQIERWQAVFFMVGAPGIPVALMLLALRDPRTGGVTSKRRAFDAELIAFFRYEWRFSVCYMASTALLVLLLNAHIAWMPAALMRAHGLRPDQIGAVFGPVYLLCGSAATLIAGAIAARPSDDILKRTLRLMRGVAVVLVPASILAPLAGSLTLQLVLVGLSVFCTSAILSMSSLPFQFAAPRTARAQAIAAQGVVASIVGTGLGPLLVGLLSDHLGSTAQPLSSALAVVAAVATPLIVVLLGVVLTNHQRLRLDLRRDEQKG